MTFEELLKKIGDSPNGDAGKFAEELKQFPEILSQLRKLVSIAREVETCYIAKYKTGTPMLDRYGHSVERILIETKASLRSGDKSMMTARNPDEGHIHSRSKHQEQVAAIMEELAKQLSLNPILARLIGMHHDDGHTFDGHTGEQIMSSIGRLLNCGYTVHNALSIEMLIEEGVIDRIKNAIKIEDPNVTEKDLKQLEQEMFLIYDGILSHNGEGTDSVIIPEIDKSTDKIKEEIIGCHTVEKYDKGIKPKTMEGALIRFADIIAYTRSDILDGFQLGIIEGFDEEALKKSQKRQNQPIREDDYYTDYLKIIGLLSQYNDNSKDSLFIKSNEISSNINITKRKIDEIESKIKKINKILISNDNLPEKKQNQGKINRLEDEKRKLEEEKELYVEQLQQIKEEKKQNDKEKIEAGREYLKSVDNNKYFVTDMMQATFIKDLVQHSNDKDYIGFSPAVSEALFALRNCNMKYIVKYTKRPFEAELLPQATLKLVEKLAGTLIESGVINEEIMPEKNKRQIDELEKEEFLLKKERGEISLYEKKILKKVNKLPKERIGEICSNAIASIPNILRNDLKIALGEKKYEGSLPKEHEEKMEKMRAKIKKEFPGIVTAEKENCPLYIITEEQQEQLLNKLIQEQRQNMEQIFAYALAKEFVEGFSDRAIRDAIVNAGILSKEVVEQGTERIHGKGIDPQAAALEKTWHDNMD